MSKMNLYFKTNMYDFDKSLPTPTVDYIVFEGNGKKISVSCFGWASFDILKGTYGANSSSYAVNTSGEVSIYDANSSSYAVNTSGEVSTYDANSSSYAEYRYSQNDDASQRISDNAVVGCHRGERRAINSSSEQLTYDATFKGLECEVSAGEEILHEYDEMKMEDFEMLKGTSITEIGIYSDNVRFINPIMAKDVAVKVLWEDEELFWHESQVPVINYDDYEHNKIKIMIENDKWELEKDLEEVAELEER